MKPPRCQGGINSFPLDKESISVTLGSRIVKQVEIEGTGPPGKIHSTFMRRTLVRMTLMVPQQPNW